MSRSQPQTHQSERLIMSSRIPTPPPPTGDPPFTPKRGKLTIRELADALYEGSSKVQNLAEELARTHGKADALSFFSMMEPDVQNFWCGIAKQLIDHSKHWLPNEGSGCILDAEETERLKKLPRVES